jgi:hypothetical protein
MITAYFDIVAIPSVPPQRGKNCHRKFFTTPRSDGLSRTCGKTAAPRKYASARNY